MGGCISKVVLFFNPGQGLLEGGGLLEFHHSLLGRVLGFEEVIEHSWRLYCVLNSRVWLQNRSKSVGIIKGCYYAGRVF